VQSSSAHDRRKQTDLSTGCDWRPMGLSPAALCLFGAALAAAAVAVLPLDVAAARWWSQSHLPGELRRLINYSEAFGHGLGVLIILLLVWQLASTRRRCMLRLASISLGAGLAADLVKLLVGRTRPRHFDLASGSVWNTFTGWLPGTAAGAAGQSFPSAHTATAVGLALALAALFPKARWTFVLLALLVACQRMQAGAHFPSDVLAGAALGCWTAAFCLTGQGLGLWFERLENPTAGGSASCNRSE